MGCIWGVVYVVTLLPFAFFILLSLVEVSYSDSWSPLVSRDALQSFEVLLFPFFLAVFIAAVVLHQRDRRASPPLRSAFGVPLPAWVVVWVAGLTILVASRQAEPPALSEEQKRELAATGCMNNLRDASVAPGYYVVVYDRRCPTAPQYTVNVSIQGSSTPIGPGNAFVVEAADSASAQQLTVLAFLPPARREVAISYDRRARILSHNSPVGGLVISLDPDSVRDH
jgi:hypothetical protein